MRAVQSCGDLMQREKGGIRREVVVNASPILSDNLEDISGTLYLGNSY